MVSRNHNVVLMLEELESRVLASAAPVLVAPGSALPFHTVAAVAVAAASQPTVRYQGRTYYVDVQGSGANLAVWFRVKPSACSSGDLNMMSLSITKSTLQQAKSKICGKVKWLRSGQMIVGCGSVAATGICALGVYTGVLTAPAALCVATLSGFAARTGGKMCLEGIRDYVVTKASGSANAAQVAMMTGASQGDIKSVIGSAFDYACS